MKRFKNILVFVNGSDSAVSLRRAVSLAEENQADVTAVDVLRPPSSLFRAFSGAHFADGVRKDVIHQRENELAALVAQHAESQTEVTTKVVVDPGFIIPQLVDKSQIELLVMGTVCRTGIPGLITGNTAELVLSDADCSALTLKPDGFQSPVSLTL